MLRWIRRLLGWTEEPKSTRPSMMDDGGEVARLREELTRLQEQTLQLARTAGELDATRQLAGRFAEERDRAVKDAETLRASIEQEVAEATRTAFEAARNELSQELNAIRRERDDLRARLANLGPAATLEAEPRLRMATTELARSLADVLGKLGAGVPVEGATASVALTTFDVEARGMLEAQEGGEPAFVTFAPGTADASQLSTLRMSFRMVPRVGGEPA